MGFYLKQFEISFKNYSLASVIRLSDFLIDHGPQGYGKPLAFLIEKLTINNHFDEAKHLYQNNQNLVKKYLSEQIIQKINPHQVQIKIDEIFDIFGPVMTSTASTIYLELPKSVTIHYIDSDDKLYLLDNLSPSLENPMINLEPLGIDSEWRPTLNVFHNSRGPSIIQISDSKHCFIIDFMSLQNSQRLCQKLQALFKERLIIAFGFISDIMQIKQYISETGENKILSGIFETFQNFIDLQDVYYKHLKLKNPPRLQFIVEQAHKASNCFNFESFEQKNAEVTLCKVEQMSNWEKRPLRDSQIHYGGLDAYVLNKIYTNLHNNKEFKNFDANSFIKTLNNDFN